MRFSRTLFGSLLFAESALCSASPFTPRGALHRRHVDFHANRLSPLERRVPQPQATTTSTGADALATWDAEAEQACMSQMDALGGTVSNPAGMAVCYNLPFMDNSTGVFEAELRMYNVSPPTGDWAGVTASDMMVSLAYLGATVQRTNGTVLGIAPNMPPSRREVSEAELRAALEKRQAAAPSEMKVLTYVGKLNANVIGPQMNLTQIQSLLIPEIELSAMNPSTKQMVQTVLSSKDASFMMGIFAGTTTDTITPASLASASAIANSATPFVLPGVTFGIFPVGFIVTMTWAVLFIAFVGLGTVGRYQFREQYKRNMKIQMNEGVKTI
ncbi:hypothetical protein NA57DRAFT_33927 [Rhizodiscina lignyota]|uniref:Uncharacterized protein n=1 Tax=Rhizodiscina lignyota TaxID=1504668 RepID=A0A9P4IGX2_9PEZI|nr:hypothetical protein NA57DRAFT_33927 [Rhizodiscina lignyota]